MFYLTVLVLVSIVSVDHDKVSMIIANGSNVTVPVK